MPLHDSRCTRCGEVTELLVEWDRRDEAQVPCPTCVGRRRLKRVIGRLRRAPEPEPVPLAPEADNDVTPRG